MNPRARLLLVVLALGGVGAAVALVGRGGSTPAGSPTSGFVPGTAPGTPLPAQCLETPARIKLPSWYPDDLPMPGGSFAVEILQEADPVYAIAFAARGTLEDFVRHALGAWPKAGWELGIGESEPGEAEDTFIHSDRDRYGKFIAREVYCADDRTLVIVQLVVDAERALPPTAGPTPTT